MSLERGDCSGIMIFQSLLRCVGVGGSYSSLVHNMPIHGELNRYFQNSSDNVQTTFALSYRICIIVPYLHYRTVFALSYRICIVVPYLHYRTVFALSYRICIIVPYLHYRTVFALSYRICIIVPYLHGRRTHGGCGAT